MQPARNRDDGCAPVTGRRHEGETTMNDELLLDRIDAMATVARPVLRGTRIPVEHVLSQLAHGASAAEIQRRYPGLTPDDIRACLLFAARGLSTGGAPPADPQGPGSPCAEPAVSAPQPVPVPVPYPLPRMPKRDQ